MIKKISALLIAFLCTLASATTLAQGANPFLGTWDIDIGQSNYGSATAPANLSRTYFDHGDESYTYMVITTAQDGSLSGSTARYSYSGEQYPIASFNQDISATISYRKIAPTTVEYTVYVDGAVQQIGAKVVTPNYQQLRIIIQFPNSDQEDQILVFNKRG
ncbi:MAG: hypothetical protein DHS20C12_02040 [Pseudohongiella sp.]|nr:MAG: hypothetical protein DHS20C12_02040 [Pseudohongiella sp.]